jgi:hypothetical protein
MSRHTFAIMQTTPGLNHRYHAILLFLTLSARVCLFESELWDQDYRPALRRLPFWLR